jgi:hypothetical protein
MTAKDWTLVVALAGLAVASASLWISYQQLQIARQA